MGKLQDKVAIVTGGGSGIGSETVLKLASEGAKVIIADWKKGQSDELVSGIQKRGGQAEFFQINVSLLDDVKRCVAHCISTYGSLDIMINNAGIGGSLAYFEDQSEEEWHRIIAINQTGVFYCMREALKQMKMQGSGAIVNTASLAGIGSAPRMGAYAASKHAVVGMTKTAASEYGKYGIRINAICPSVIDTPMGQDYMSHNDDLAKVIKQAIPMKRFGSPSEVADVVCWLCTDDSSFVTGETIRIDGGHRS